MEEDEDDENFFESLQTLGWIRRGACLTEPLGRAIHEMILSQVRSSIQGEFEEDALFESVQAWKDAVVVSSVFDECCVVVACSRESCPVPKLILTYTHLLFLQEPWVRDFVGEEDFIKDNWAARLLYCTAECFCLVRMEELFDIIADHPDSQPAVLELRQVLEKTNMHLQLGETLQQSLKKRLIHPGANTSQIIDVYINTIKVCTCV